MRRLLIILCSLVPITSVVAQTAPPLMNYQGSLTDESGAPLPDGQYLLAFRIYTNAIPVPGESLIWGREYEAYLVGGAFNVVLGESNGDPVAEPAAVNELTFAFTGSNRFLELQVVRDAESNIVNHTILPRQQMLSTPYSFTAASLIKKFQEALCPPGSIMPFGGSSVPDGWLFCDGSAVNSQEFPGLFSAISTNWGAGDGTTNDFNLPDLRGMFLRGVNGERADSFADNDATNRLASIADGSPNTGGEVSGNSENNVGSVQREQIHKHYHRWGRVASNANPGLVGLDTFYDGSGALRSLLRQEGDLQINKGSDFADNFKNVKPPGNKDLHTDPNSLVETPSATTETRPNNAYVNYIIKY